MRTKQIFFFLSLSAGLLTGVMGGFQTTAAVVQRAQTEKQRPAIPQSIVADTLYAKLGSATSVLGVVRGVDPTKRQIALDALSPYPEGGTFAVLLTYSASTTATGVSPDSGLVLPVNIDTMPAGTRIITNTPREAGALRATRLFIQS